MAHADEWAQARWLRYIKHLPPNPRKKKWDRVVAETGQRGHKSYYHPDLLLAEIEQMEMRCQSQGTLLYETSLHKYYWLEFDYVVGASGGEQTQFILVEYEKNGNVHGHPVTRSELIRKGAAL